MCCASAPINVLNARSRRRPLGRLRRPRQHAAATRTSPLLPGARRLRENPRWESAMSMILCGCRRRVPRLGTGCLQRSRRRILRRCRRQVPRLGTRCPERSPRWVSAISTSHEGSVGVDAWGTVGLADALLSCCELIMVRCEYPRYGSRTGTSPSAPASPRIARRDAPPGARHITDQHTNNRVEADPRTASAACHCKASDTESVQTRPTDR